VLLGVSAIEIVDEGEAVGCPSGVNVGEASVGAVEVAITGAQAANTAASTKIF
jgi:hypothetical protein